MGSSISPFLIAQVLFMTGPLLAVPMALRVFELRSPNSARWKIARIGAVPAAILLVPSFLVAPGWVSASLALPWLAFCLLLVLLGALRFAGRGGRLIPAELSMECALFFLSIGAIWLVASRLGRGFLGFEEPIVFLTASPLHFAAFVLPLVAGSWSEVFRLAWPNGRRQELSSACRSLRWGLRFPGLARRCLSSSQPGFSAL